jgi:RimJ/RimL family protein N-acetyltransferase
MPSVFLRTERLDLRALEPGDGPLLAACNNDPAVRLTFFTHTPTSVAREEERISRLYGPGADHLPLAIVVREEARAIGVTALHRLDLVSGAAVFSICITSEPHRSRGFGSEATEAMMRWAFQVLGLHRVQLHVWTENEAAVRAYRRVGFELEGTLREAMQHDGRRCDFHVMGLLAREWRAANSQPEV